LRFPGNKRDLVNAGNKRISVRRQCDLLGLNRSTYYYRQIGESEENQLLMAEIDRIYTERPYFGARRITKYLNKIMKWGNVNRKRVSRLMRLMGIEAIYPKPRLSKPSEGNHKYPYLLKGMPINHPNQVWSSDITYIPTAKGFVYLVAIIDWHSRYVLSWEVSNSMESSFCVKALERAISKYGVPEIFNSDQGSQFTDRRFVGVLEREGIRISMDGRGRCLDNIFIERLWRSVKYEEVYIKGYETLPEARAGLREYFLFYNVGRLHQSLDYKTPSEVHFAREDDGDGLPPEAGTISLKSVA
jgi:putative transposase